MSDNPSKTKKLAHLFKNLWPKHPIGYTAWVLIIGLVPFLSMSFFAASGLPVLVFLIGLPLLGNLKSLNRFLPVALLTAVILLLTFVRSDFVDMVLHGTGIGRAYQTSTRYFQAPMIMWFTIWAVVVAASNLTEARGAVVFKWLSWLMMILIVLEGIDALSKMGLSNALNDHWFGAKRPEMVVVKVSNTNFVLLMMFWPLCYYFMQRRQIGWVIAQTIVVAAAAVVVDTNAQILALVLAWFVFLAARYWPRGLSVKGITPERVMAALAGITTLVFPVIVYLVMRSGMSERLKAHMGPSWAARIDIWSFTVSRSLEKPIWGWGYEQSRRFEPMIPDHPHNMSLQAWLELGLPGLALLAALWFAVFWFMAPKGEDGQRPSSSDMRELSFVPEITQISAAQLARPYMLALATSFFVINTISFGAWKLWLYCLGALATAAAILAVKAVSEYRKLHY